MVAGTARGVTVASVAQTPPVTPSSDSGVTPSSSHTLRTSSGCQTRSGGRSRIGTSGLRPLVTTRTFADAVIGNLSAARTDTEHFEEVWR